VDRKELIDFYARCGQLVTVASLVTAYYVAIVLSVVLCELIITTNVNNLLTAAELI